MMAVPPAKLTLLTMTQDTLKPRKYPIQSRSVATVDAILEATAQVLVADGKGRLTTNRVAERAGVCIGTLYQYFPNKNSLLQATLRHYFANLSAAVVAVCERERNRPTAVQSAALAEAFLGRKDRDLRRALYDISEGVECQSLFRLVKNEMHLPIQILIESASDGPVSNPVLAATTLLGLMSGMSLQVLDLRAPIEHHDALLRELQASMTAYLGFRTVA